MTPWLVTLGALLLASACDFKWRRIPIWLPLCPLVAFIATEPRPTLARFLVLFSSGLAVLALWAARTGLGDVAMMLPVALTLEWWAFFAAAVALVGGWFTLRARHKGDDPFMPHVTLGFLAASLARWWLP